MSSLIVAMLDSVCMGSLVLIPILLICKYSSRISSEHKHLLLLIVLLSLLIIPAAYLIVKSTDFHTENYAIEPIEFNQIVNVERAENSVNPDITVSRRNRYIGDFRMNLSSSMIPTLAGLWAVGFIMITGKLIIGILLVNRMIRNTQPLTEKAQTKLLEELCEKLGIKKTVSLVKSQKAVSPSICGILRPVIILPSECENWLPEMFKIVLLHELNHIRRADNLTFRVARTILALYWFNPVIWMAVNRLRIEQESSCDDRVLSSGIKPGVYAGHLLDVVRSYHFPKLAIEAVNSMGRLSNTEQRIHNILNSKINHGVLSKNLRLQRILPVMSVIILSLFVLILRAQGFSNLDRLKVTYDADGRYSITSGAWMAYMNMKPVTIPVLSPVQKNAATLVGEFDKASKGVIFRIDHEYSAVLSTADGVVQRIGENVAGQKYVIIGHAQGILTIYANMNELFVREGQEVLQGQEIGCTGMKRSLYYQIRIGEHPTDPLSFMNPIALF